MSVNLKLFAESEAEVLELQRLAEETVSDLYSKGYVVSSDTFIRLLNKVRHNPLLTKLL